MPGGFIVEDFFFLKENVWVFSGPGESRTLLFTLPILLLLEKKLTPPCEVESSCISEEAARSENLASQEYIVINFRSSDRLRSWDFPQLLHFGFQLFKVTWCFSLSQMGKGGVFCDRKNQTKPRIS